MNQNFVTIDWGASELKGAIIAQGETIGTIRLSAGNLRHLHASPLSELTITLNSAIKKYCNESFKMLIGAAGANDASAVNRLKNSCQMNIMNMTDIEIYTDYAANHAACFANKDGIISINGTGSLLYAVFGQIEIVRGGWGYILDETPSSAWFGKKASEGILRHLDGETDYKDYVEAWEKLYQNSPTRSSVINDLYSAEQIQPLLGKRGKILTLAADNGSTVALKQIEDSIDKLVILVNNLAQIHSAKPISFCGHGGLWQNWAPFEKIFEKKLKAMKLPVKLCKPSFKSEYGALIIYSRTNEDARQTIPV